MRIVLFLKLWYETIRNKFQVKIKFIKCIIFLHLKFFSWKIIFSFSNYPFNNNIAILESKIIYFFLRSIFREGTTSYVFLNLAKYLKTHVMKYFLIMLNNFFPQLFMGRSIWVNFCKQFCSCNKRISYKKSNGALRVKAE